MNEWVDRWRDIQTDGMPGLKLQLILLSGVTLDKLLNISVPQFPPLLKRE